MYDLQCSASRVHTLCCGKRAVCSEQACPALGCAAAPKPITAECLANGIPQYWGRFAAQRRASLLTTVNLLTSMWGVMAG